MARFRRWYRRRYGRRSWMRFRRYRRRYRRFANSSSRSRVRIKIPVQFNVSLSVPAADTESNVLTVCPFFNNFTATPGGLSEAAVRGGLLSSQLFTTYAALYDSFKVDGMKVAVSITSPVGAGQGAFPSLSVYTAWDRKFERSDFTTAADYPTVTKMRVQSSFLASTAVNNSITKLQRSCYASDLFEKGSFIDCYGTLLQAQQIAGVANQDLQAFTTGSGVNPPVASPAFSPCFMFGVDTGSSVDAISARPVNLVVEVMYYVTYRNPKYGGTSGIAKVDAIQRSVTFGDLDDDDDMDDDGPRLMDDDAPATASADPPSRRSVMSTTSKGPSHADRARAIQRAERARDLAAARGQPLNE